MERRDPSELLDDNEEVDGSDVDMDDDDHSAESESESEESASISGESTLEDADLELRNKIEEALRSSGIQPATEDGSESEELLDDEQMMAVDEHLTNVFRSRIDGKRKSLVPLNVIFSKLIVGSRCRCAKRGDAFQEPRPRSS